jgi:hypothetical protein
MKRAGAFLLALTLGLFVAGSASAGFLEITYDLAGSTINTTTALGTDSDPLTGTLVLRFGATTSMAPITSATLAGGNTFASISQPNPGLLTIIGSTNTQLSPGTGVAAVGLTAYAVTFPPIPASISGFLHCTGGLCNLGGFTASVSVPVTGSLATFPPLFFFTGGVAVDTNFSGTLTQTPQAGVTVVTNYVGTETGRIFVPEPGKLLLMGSGIATLALLGALRLRRNG